MILRPHIITFILAFSVFFQLNGQKAADKDIELGLYHYNQLNYYYSELMLDSMFLYGEKAFSLLHESSHKEEAAISLIYMAIAKDWSGEKRESKKYADQILQFTSENIGKQNDLYNTGLNILGAYYQDIGDYDNALDVYEEAIQNHKQGDEIDPLSLSRYYTNLGILHYSFGETANSVAALENAMRLMSSSKNRTKSEQAAIQVNLANAYLKENNLTLAKQHFSECLIEIEDLKGRYDVQNKIYCYQGLAEIYMTGNKADSVRLCLLQLQEIRDLYGDQFQLDFKSYAIAGKLYAQLNEMRTADTLYDRSIRTAKLWYKDFKKNAEVAAMLLQKAQMYHQYKSIESALDIYQKALVENSSAFEATDWQENPDYIQFLNPSYGLQIWTGKAKVLYELYLETKNEQYLNEAIEVCELTTRLIFHIRNTYKAAQAKLFLSDQVVPFYELAILVSLEKYQITQHLENVDMAFQFAESNKAILLLESLSRNKALMASNLNSDIVDKENELNQEIAYYQKAIAENRQKEITPEIAQQFEDWEAILFELKEQREQTLDSLNILFPRIYNQDVSSNIISGKDLKKDILSSRQALLEIFIGEQYVFVFLIHKHGIEVHKTAKIPQLKKAVIDLNEILHSPPQSQQFQADFEKFVSSSHFIYQELFSPLLPELSQKVNSLIVVPDGFLSLIPFEILQTTNHLPQKANYGLDHMQYLLEDYNIFYQYSANMLAQFAEEKSSYGELNILASAPVFHPEEYAAERNCEQSELYNLQCNQEEIERIKSVLSSEASFTSDNSASSFMSKMHDFNILHLATHACLDTENPKNTRIFFSDDYLTAYDLVGVRFEPELIVLSACNTGTGKLLNGEGVFSLAREFTIAGSRSTLTSFWSIDDCSTSQIMESFYECMKNGDAKNLALRKTKLKFLETADMETAHPYYWAAFLLFGDSTPLYTTNKNWMYALVGLLILLGVLLVFRKWSTKNVFKNRF